MGVIKSGKVVIVLQGRFAGHKAIVVKAHDDGTADKKFAHAIVAGIDRYPRKVTRAMTKDKIEKRTKMKPFLKAINYTHLMPTRYVVDIDLKKYATDDCLKENRSDARKGIKKLFEDRYRSQTSGKKEKKAAGVSYFYKKMAF
mmetsp:Transcript_12371/g.38137  ORF Transcript_12371/g.38137 Transcript_12371/m.38137 type:complete len:143 (-) Transcript_12371:78-506(-)